MSAAPAPSALPREQLEPRRLQITEAVKWNQCHWLVSIGFDRGGVAREVFAQGAKTGSHFEGLLDDTCILISRLLQSGDTPRDLARSLGALPGQQETAAPIPGQPRSATITIAGEDPAQSPAAMLLNRIAAIEAICGGEIREAYELADGPAV